MKPHIVFIATPLEQEHVERIRGVAPELVEVVYRPDLLPAIRYTADHKGAAATRSAEQETEWLEALARANILWDFPADIAQTPKVRWIQTTSTGVGQYVLKAGLRETDIVITTARGVHAGPLAEFAMLGLLAHFRGLRHLEAEQKAHRWIRYCGGEMAGKTLLTIGAGDLARASAERARAFEMRTEAITRHPDKMREHGHVFDAVHPVSELHGALGRADALVITTPHTAETEQMIDAAAFAAMKPGIALVNIARGQIVDEDALIRHLRTGHVAFAALDVAAEEPLPEASPLWDLQNVLISPHSASTVEAENARITEIFCYNLRHYADGHPERMKNIFDKELLY